jgi:hypothetical protein
MNGIGPRHYEYSNYILLFSKNFNDSRLSRHHRNRYTPTHYFGCLRLPALTMPVHSLVEIYHRHR